MNTLIEQVKTEIAYRGYSERTSKSYCEQLHKLSQPQIGLNRSHSVPLYISNIKGWLIFF